MLIANVVAVVLGWFTFYKMSVGATASDSGMIIGSVLIVFTLSQKVLEKVLNHINPEEEQ